MEQAGRDTTNKSKHAKETTQELIALQEEIDKK